MGIKPKELSKLGYTQHVTRSLIVNTIKKYGKHSSKEELLALLSDIRISPDKYKNDTVWGKLAEHLNPTIIDKPVETFHLLDQHITYKTYGGKTIESAARQQMELAMRLPVTVAGALMPDAHVGYGLPIGGVLAVENAVIPYAVGVDIGCRMSLSIWDAKPDYLKRYPHQVKEALKTYTHFGMDGGLPFEQEHEVLDRNEFQLTPLLKTLHGKAVRQLGTSGGGNHFVEFGEISLTEGNVMNLPEGDYIALLSHSGSRGMGAEIARHYSQIAREVCKLPREAQHLAWLSLDTEAGQEYWTSMHLAGDFARASHGAGRAMSRQKAKEQFTQSSLKKLLIAQGVTLIGGSVEETPLAYKDIDRVMPAQESLVDIHGKFIPRIVRMNKE